MTSPSFSADTDNMNGFTSRTRARAVDITSQTAPDSQGDWPSHHATRQLHAVVGGVNQSLGGRMDDMADRTDNVANNYRQTEATNTAGVKDAMGMLTGGAKDLTGIVTSGAQTGVQMTTTAATASLQATTTAANAAVTAATTAAKGATPGSPASLTGAAPPDSPTHSADKPHDSDGSSDNDHAHTAPS
jgi:hypothetical protein